MSAIKDRSFGSKKLWVAYSGLGSILLLAMTGNGDPAAYGAIGLITTVTVGAIGAKDYKTGPQSSG